MPTPEEIKKASMANDDMWTLAEQYADKECELSSLEDKGLLQLHEDKIIEFLDVYGFLCDNYCIVPKSEVKAEYKKSYSESFAHTTCLDRQYARGRYQVLREIFGKELFNEEKE